MFIKIKTCKFYENICVTSFELLNSVEHNLKTVYLEKRICIFFFIFIYLTINLLVFTFFFFLEKPIINVFN